MTRIKKQNALYGWGNVKFFLTVLPRDLFRNPIKSQSVVEHFCKNSYYLCKKAPS